MSSHADTIRRRADLFAGRPDEQQLIADHAGKPLRYELVDFHTSRPGHDLRYALDGELMQSLGWTPPVPLEASLRKTIEWTLNHPQWLLTDQAAA